MRYDGIVLTGPQASGKSTIARELSSFDNRFQQVRAVTTRPQREDDEGEYDYITQEEFAALGSDLLIATEYDSHYYGIRNADINAVLQQQKIPVLTITPASAAERYGLTRKSCQEQPSRFPTYLTYALDAPDDVLDARLSGRSSSNEPISRRAAKQRRDQRTRDRSVESHFVYSIQNLDVDRTVSLIIALWDHANEGGVLPARLMYLMISGGLLLNNAEVKNIEGASYDLRLGDELFYGGRPHRLSDEEPMHMIEPYDYAIVTSREVANLPGDVSARFDLSVGLFCQGVILSNGPQVDPGFHGPLFCLLFNTSSTPVLLRRGQHYATIEFHKLVAPTFRYSGPYLAKSLIEYLPANAAQGAINELKKELEQVREASGKLQNAVLTIVSLILAFIAICVTLFLRK